MRRRARGPRRIRGRRSYRALTHERQLPCHVLARAERPARARRAGHWPDGWHGVADARNANPAGARRAWRARASSRAYRASPPSATRDLSRRTRHGNRRDCFHARRVSGREGEPMTLDPVELLHRMVEIESVSGHEGELAVFLAERMRA